MDAGAWKTVSKTLVLAGGAAPVCTIALVIESRNATSATSAVCMLLGNDYPQSMCLIIYFSTAQSA